MIKTGCPRVFIVLAFVIYSPFLIAQECPCCDEFHKQFDFWLGEWTVYDSTGQLVGSNSVTKIQKGCLLMENWTSANNNTGTSYNYFNQTDSTWNQVWVDDQGGILELKGNFTGHAMVLMSDLLQGKKMAHYYHRITWEPKDGGVIQTWEVMDEMKQVKSLLFEGFYKKVDRPDEH